MANGNSHQDLNSIHVSFIWSITKETSNHFHLMLFYCFNTTSENWKSIGIYLLFLQPAHFRIQAHEIIAPIESKWYSYNSTNLRKIWILFLIGYSWYSTKGKSLNGWKKGWKNSQGKAWDFISGLKGPYLNLDSQSQLIVEFSLIFSKVIDYSIFLFTEQIMYIDLVAHPI